MPSKAKPTMFTAHNLHQALAGIGIQQPGDIFEQLAIAYSEPWRHYHTQIHISHCLKLARNHQASRPHELELALWFHDAIYDPHRQDNEQKSAQWAQAYLHHHQTSPGIIHRITAMIHATQTHQASNPETQLLLDLDLSILGAPSSAFEAYDQAIRREYQWVPESDYRRSRCRILQTFLQRHSLYQTPNFQAKYETQARQNLAKKIIALQEDSLK